MWFDLNGLDKSQHVNMAEHIEGTFGYDINAYARPARGCVCFDWIRFCFI